MAILNRNELSARLQEMFGEQDDEQSLTFMEDLSDTLDEYERNSNTERVTQLEGELSDLRDKYRKRFFTPKEEQDDEPGVHHEEDKPKKLTFESLFTQE